MNKFELDNAFFLSHHCPPIKMTERELNRLREAVNWKIKNLSEALEEVNAIFDKYIPVPHIYPGPLAKAIDEWREKYKK